MIPLTIIQFSLQLCKDILVMEKYTTILCDSISHRNTPKDCFSLKPGVMLAANARHPKPFKSYELLVVYEEISLVRPRITKSKSAPKDLG